MGPSHQSMRTERVTQGMEPNPFWIPARSTALSNDFLTLS